MTAHVEVSPAGRQASPKTPRAKRPLTKAPQPARTPTTPPVCKYTPALPFSSSVFTGRGCRRENKIVRFFFRPRLQPQLLLMMMMMLLLLLRLRLPPPPLPPPPVFPQTQRISSLEEVCSTEEWRFVSLIGSRSGVMGRQGCYYLRVILTIMWYRSLF